MNECKSIWRRISKRVVLPLEEGDEFAGTADEVAAKLETEDDAVASALLAQAERAAAEPHDRADGAERRATTLQGAVAIAASFGVASAALLLDSNKITSNGWREAFAVVSLGFVFCLVAAGFRAVGAVYRVHRWRYPDNEEIYEQAKMSAAAAKTRRAASLLRTIPRNQAIARWKVAYMRAAAWWFRLALLFLLVDAVLLTAYAFVGSRIPHMHIPFDRSRQLDLFFSVYFPVGMIAGVFVGLIVLWVDRRETPRGARDRRQGIWFALLLTTFAVVCVAGWYLPSWRVYTPWIRYMGVLVLLADLVWVTWSYVLLGESRSGRVDPRQGGRLQTGGSFAFVRHPTYLGLLVLGFGAALLFSWVAAIAIVGFALVAYDVARVEEPLLLKAFGEGYARYTNCTPNRILPFDRHWYPRLDRALAGIERALT